MRKLLDIVQFNPTEKIVKGAIAKKLAMEYLQPFTREISGYEFAPFSGGSKFRNGDTIMARITPCLENGKTAYVSILDKDEVGFGSTEYIVFRNIDGVTDSKYIYYLVTSPWFRNIAIKSMVGSSGRQRVQQSVLEDLEIDLPPIEEQKRIAGILSALDNKIELNRRINANLELQAQTLFNHWFVDFEFPNADGKPYKSSGGKLIDSPLDPIPEGWRIGSVNDIIDIQSGFAFKSEDFVDAGKYRLVTIKNVQDGNMDIAGAVYIDDVPYKMPSYCILQCGDILLSLTGNVGRCCIVDRQDLLLNQRVAKLHPINKADILFTYAMFRNETFKNKMISIARGTAQMNLSPIETGQLQIIIPDDVTLKRFGKYGTPIYQSLLNNRQENIRLAQLRDTLLPKLMNGENK